LFVFRTIVVCYGGRGDNPNQVAAKKKEYISKKKELE